VSFAEIVLKYLVFNCDEHSLEGNCVYAVSVGAGFQHLGVFGMMVYLLTLINEFNKFEIHLNLKKKDEEQTENVYNINEPN
jgi:hypothetical protein